MSIFRSPSWSQQLLVYLAAWQFVVIIMRNRLSPVIRCLRSLCFLVTWVEIYSSSLGLEFVVEDKGDGINNILTRTSFFLGIFKYSAGDQSLFRFPCWGHLCTMDGILKNSDKSQSQNVRQHCYIPLLFFMFLLNYFDYKIRQRTLLHSFFFCHSALSNRFSK